MNEGLSFDDVLLIPRPSDIESRQETSVSSTIIRGLADFRSPIVSAPMDTVSGIDLVAEVTLHGGLGVLHRFMPLEEQLKQAKELIRGRIFRFGVAVGIREDPMPQIEELFQIGVRIVIIDVANGYTKKVRETVAKIKDKFGEDLKVVAGSVATYVGAEDLCWAGADAIRVGVGPGAVCSTREVTGVGVPQLTAIEVCVDASDRFDVPVIADGGIRNSGDIVKALAIGANSVMLGRLFAGADEAPGWDSRTKIKDYRGMASETAQRERDKSFIGIPHVEGISTVVPGTGPVGETMTKLHYGIRSGMSYVGARTIPELQVLASFIKLSESAKEESRAKG
jgi:IMP dehydrogenase